MEKCRGRNCRPFAGSPFFLRMPAFLALVLKQKKEMQLYGRIAASLEALSHGFWLGAPPVRTTPRLAHHQCGHQQGPRPHSGRN